MSRLIRSLGVGAVVLTLLAAYSLSPVSAATYTLTPFTFVGPANYCGNPYPAGTPGGVVANWDTSSGNPAPSLFLAKNVATTDCSAAGATVNGVSGITLTELNFDVMGYCGAGAPRFNVVTSDNVTHFFGCAGGTQTALGNGWTHVTFTPAQGYPPVTSGTTVTSIEIIQDEQGQTHLDNVSINNQVIGGPSTPTSKEACKNGGWQSLRDANGNTFKNQGQCVSYFNHQNGRGNDDENSNDNNGNGNGQHGNGDQGDNDNED